MNFPFQIDDCHEDYYGKIDEKDKANGPNHAPSFIHFQVSCLSEREQSQVICDKLQTHFIEKLLALARFGLVRPNFTQIQEVEQIICQEDMDENVRILCTYGC